MLRRDRSGHALPGGPRGHAEGLESAALAAAATFQRHATIHLGQAEANRGGYRGCAGASIQFDQDRGDVF